MRLLPPAFLALLLLLLLVPTAKALENADCLGCHADVDTVGEAFRVDPVRFDTTAHAGIGCNECHASISEQHPDDGQPISKASCSDCHADIADEYAVSNHAGVAVCNDCHNPHTVRGATAVSGYAMNEQCANCHDREENVIIHSKWLPQGELHLNSLPCISCHTASQELVTTLYLVRREEGQRFGQFSLASYAELQALAGDGKISGLIDRNGDDYISIAELRTFNRDPANRALRLHGMMTPETFTHDFVTLDNRWDCTFCHASGPGAMQTSFVALPLADASFERLATEKGAVLDALYGTPDFYMVGATRSKTLDIIGLVIIACGMAMPIGHGTLRFLTRKNRRS